jgi:DeoR family glycerol-3-phosphate regulon repressor
VLAAERQRRILAVLEGSSSVETDDLASRLGVSAETVRRDLGLMEQRGQLHRVHGGATSLGILTGQEPSYAERADEAKREKAAIGALAASLVRPGCTAVIDVGTTCLSLARALPHDLRATIATPSLLVAAELSTRRGVTVLVPGGQVRAGDLACSGADTVAFFSDLNAEIALLGSGGLSAAAGLTDYHRDEVATKRSVIARAREVYVLADAAKLDVAGPHRVCDLADLDGVITDCTPSPAFRKAAKQAGLAILTAEPGH